MQSASSTSSKHVDRKPSTSHSSNRSRITQKLIQRLGGKTVFLIVIAAIIGVGAGYGAIVFRGLIHMINRLAYPQGIMLSELKALPWYALVLPPLIGGAVVGPLIYYLAREAKGHGVPEVMEAVANRGGRIRKRVALVKTLASAISIGVGAAVGREGPIVQIGSSLASSLGQVFHLDARSLKLLVGCGAAAGIAATFNAPIAGALFALEVILGIGSISVFTPLVVSSVVATAISRYHLGDIPAFSIPRYSLASAWELPFYVVLGLLAAVVGVSFSRGLYKMEDLWERIPFPEIVKTALGGALIGAMALVFPHVMGVGYESIEAVLVGDARFGLSLILMLLVAKMLATHLSLAAGFSGGVFAPSLFVGAMLGGSFGLVLNMLMPEGLVAPCGAYAVVAMGAVVSASVQAPLSAILIVFEMTSDYRIILPLMLACLIASVFSQRLSRESIYTLKLIRRGSRLAHLGRDEVMESTSVEALIRPVSWTMQLSTTLNEIIEQALESGFASTYVTDVAGTLRGALYLEDISTLIRDADTLQHLLVAADIMRPVYETVRPDESLARCLRRLGHQGLEKLPVVNQEGQLVGCISRSDIITLYDREALRRDVQSMAFVDSDNPDTSRPQIIKIPAGEGVDTIPVGNAFAGKSLRDLNLRACYDVNVVGIKVGDTDLIRIPNSVEILTEGDILVVEGTPERIRELRQWAGIPD